MIIQYQEHKPLIKEKVFIADGAKIIGKVNISPYVSIWYNCVLRGDLEMITIGERTNIQDLSVIHTNPGQPTTIEEDVSIGHSCVLHGCKIRKGCLIGMGSIILNDAEIGENCLVGAGSLIPERKIFPPGSLIMGSPAKVVRSLTPEEINSLADLAQRYVERGQEYLNNLQK